MNVNLRLPDRPPQTRSQLLSLLTQACEIEHGLACSYLFAAFTLKQDFAEGGLTWDQLQRVRLWAAQIYFVAADEMLHLAQVWNLQTAIGGTPYYLRPNFPLPSHYYPLNLPVALERFSLAALDRFIQYERPANLPLEPETPIIGPASPGFNTVGDLYGLIAAGFESIPEERLFIGLPERQVDAELIDFPKILRVYDRSSALSAIAAIVEQGEGLQHQRDDCHFGMFRGIRIEYLRHLADGEAAHEPFEPARPCLSNPIAQPTAVYEAEGANHITDSYAAEVADIFDSAYGLMLRCLQFVFDAPSGEKDLRVRLSRTALDLMTTVIKPLGEALTLLPAGALYENQRAGPGFALARHVPLPSHSAATEVMVTEKLNEIAIRLEAARTDARAPRQLSSATKSVQALANGTRKVPAHHTAPTAVVRGEGAGADGRAAPTTTD